MDIFLIFLVGVFIGLMLVAMSPGVVVVNEFKGKKYIKYKDGLYRLIEVDWKETEDDKS